MTDPFTTYLEMVGLDPDTEAVEYRAGQDWLVVNGQVVRLDALDVRQRT